MMIALLLLQLSFPHAWAGWVLGTHWSVSRICPELPARMGRLFCFHGEQFGPMGQALLR